MASAETTDQNNWDGMHGLDARYRLPWFGGPIYIRVMVGRDRRPKIRTKAHSAASVRRSIFNIVLFALGACVLYTSIGAALLLLSAIVH